MNAEPRQCLECSGELHEIKLIDKGHFNSHSSLEYTVPDAKVSFWTGKTSVTGRVKSYMCNSCGRIALYGVEAGA